MNKEQIKQNIKQDIMDLQSTLTEYELKRETTLNIDLKVVDLVVSLVKNRIECCKLLLLGMNSRSPRLQDLINTRIKKCIELRQEIMQGFSDYGSINDQTYIEQCNKNMEFMQILDA
tara:strand:+ start:621 stop:971 length:351 start_codon:yes stop_codon:yes gene_type:complete